MENTEYYKIREDWPQPADEPGTLETAAPITVAPAPKKKSSTRRNRKKLSESLAGITAAAVAVVMVTSAVPEFFGKPDTDVNRPTLELPEVCPVCDDRDCPYYSWGRYGLRVGDDAHRYEYLEEDDIYSMKGFTVEDEFSFGNTGAVRTTDGRRVVIRINQNMADLLPTELWETPIEMGGEGPESQKPTAAGLYWQYLDDKSGEELFLIAALAYFPKGNPYPLDPYSLMYTHQARGGVEYDNLSHLCLDVPQVPGVQIQLLTNIPGMDLEKVRGCVETTVIEEQLLTYELGETMLYTETEDNHRSFMDTCHGGEGQYFDFQRPEGNLPVELVQNYTVKNYGLTTQMLNDTRIRFLGFDWHEWFGKWQQLNEDAPKTGHEVFFPLVQLEDVTVNDITYTVYAYYAADPVDVMEYSWIWYYYIPQNEGNIAIVDLWGIEEEEIREVLRTNRVLDFHGDMFKDYVLSQITLRDGDTAGGNSNPKPVDPTLCSVCGRNECPYYSYGALGLRITMNESPMYQDTDDLYSMAGFSRDDEIYTPFTGALMSESGQRVALRMNKYDIWSLISFGKGPFTHGNDLMRYDPQAVAHTDMTIRITSDIDNRERFLYIGLVSDPMDRLPGDWSYIKNNMIDAHHRFEQEDVRILRTPVSDAEGIELWLMTDDETLDLNKVLELVEVETVPEGDLVFDLGSTVKFTESDQWQRTYNDGAYWGATTEYGFNSETGGKSHFSEWAFMIKEYGLYSNGKDFQSIFVAAVSWDEMFAQWQKLNEEAPQYGHEVYFQVLQLENVEVNGLTYHVYATYNDGAVYELNHERKLCYWYVLEQEPTIALRSPYIEEISMFNATLETKQVQDNFGMTMFDPIDQITLR